MVLAVKILSKKPSAELLNLIKEIGQLSRKLSDLFERIKEKGREEGFTDNELKDLLRAHLKGLLTRGQINWYVHEKDKMILRKQLTITGQIDGKNVIEQQSTQAEFLRHRAETHEIHFIDKREPENKIGIETTGISDEQNIRNLKAVIIDQQQYIAKLEGILQEKMEIQRAQSRQKVRVPVSLLYRDIVMLRNSGATEIHIIIDDGKYVGLERI